MVIFKSQNEIDRIRKASQIVARTLNFLESHVQPGITTRELDQIAESEIRKAGAIPAFKGYRGFPATLCVSVNEEVVHGIPGKRVLIPGDIVGIDLGAIVDGWHGDSAITIAVGGVASEEAMRLLKVTKDALFKGIEQAKPGKRLSDIGLRFNRMLRGQAIQLSESW
jgi:methionyl aminopeptidase